jgi:hypothetical protein
MDRSISLLLILGKRDTWEYIRQNPINAGLSNTPEEYAFFWQESEPNQFL